MLALLCSGTSLAQHSWPVAGGETPVWVRIVQAGETEAEVESADEGAAWYEYGNTETDAYLFSFGDPDDVRLALQFRRDDLGALIAEIYLHQGGSLPLEYVVDSGRLVVSSHDGHPQVRVTARDGSWLEDGLPSFNVDVEIDRAGPLGPRSRVIAPNGNIDSLLRVWGSAPGIPSVMTSTLLYDPYPGDAYGRFGAAARMPGAPAFKMSDPWMPTFPLFEVGNRDVDWYRENPVPISFDTRSMRLRIRSFVGFHTAGMYQIGSNHQPPLIDFESPFVFLNYLPESRQPQVVVRNFMFPANTPFGEGERHLDFSNIRFSWKTDSETRWRYNLHLSDAFAFDDEIQIGDTVVRAVDGPSLPQRLLERPWAQVTFVEATEGFPGSEGVYFFNPIDTSTPGGSQYLRDPTLPDDTQLNPYSSSGLPPAFRGQYQLEHGQSTRLYVSPIDGAVHLLHADGGAWNLGEGTLLRYHNLDGGPYIDGWTLERATTFDDEGRRYAEGSEWLEGLYALPGHLVYARESTVVIKATAVEPVQTRLIPPTDAEGWNEFRNAVAPLSPRDPRSLREWIESIPGEDRRIEGFSLREARVTPSGFELVLLDAGASDGALSALGTKGDATGPITVLRYAVDSGVWSAAPGSPPALVGGVGSASPSPYAPVELPVTVANHGSIGLQGQASLRIGEETVAEWSSVELPANGNWIETVHWVPTRVGAFPAMLTVGDKTVELGQIVVSPTQQDWTARRAWFGVTDAGPARVSVLAVSILASLAILLFTFYSTLDQRDRP